MFNHFFRSSVLIVGMNGRPPDASCVALKLGEFMTNSTTKPNLQIKTQFFSSFLSPQSRSPWLTVLSELDDSSSSSPPAQLQSDCLPLIAQVDWDQSGPKIINMKRPPDDKEHFEFQPNYYSRF